MDSSDSATRNGTTGGLGQGLRGSGPDPLLVQPFLFFSSFYFGKKDPTFSISVKYTAARDGMSWFALKTRYIEVVRSSLCLNCARIIVCMYAWHFIKLALLQRSHPLLPLASDTSLSRLMRCDKSRKQTRLKKKFVKNKSNGNKQQGSARVIDDLSQGPATSMVCLNWTSSTIFLSATTPAGCGFFCTIPILFLTVSFITRNNPIFSLNCFRKQSLPDMLLT